MSALRKAFGVLCVVWAGSLWSLLWVATIIFNATQGDRHFAGILVGKLFSIETYLAVAAAAAALLLTRGGGFKWGYIAAALLAVNQWALKPAMSRAQVEGTALGLGFGAWHGVAAALYLGACLAVTVLIWQDRPGGADPRLINPG